MDYQNDPDDEEHWNPEHEHNDVDKLKLTSSAVPLATNYAIALMRGGMCVCVSVCL